ncbi:prolipoprotein diacylglyceryl transferase [Corynebacterium callunae]|uniref:prolipoprotein diacylglyceryl transferase n=1 Tax=Corynebacterium callunae TaxID=1721 RepID=UPI001FFFA73F|nr:prolipoprotein diacylglyceryl transferase [Corynebacterium callunae]MCK2199497.1 prolipoprotein diacylglyceryl transferase [Corynebacterium callunae]
MTLAAIPSPPQGVWFLGPIPIRAYALCIITGIVVAIWLTRKRYAARGGNPELVLDAAIVAVPAGIIGGRLYHVITDNQKYFCDTCDPVDALKITNGGLGIWGAVILGGLAVAAYFRYKKLPLAPFADAVAPGVILAQGIGRLGNWFNQELYGAQTNAPWALEIYYRVDEQGKFAPVTGTSTGEIMATVHPTFLYELLWNLLVFAFLMWADKRFTLGHGRVFALYVAGYTLGRFWIEQMRVDEATMVFGMRINTLVSAVVFIGAVVVFFLLKPGREKPAEVDPTFAASVAAADGESAAESLDLKTSKKPETTERTEP